MDRDQQLIAYLDSKFEGIDRRFEGIDRRFEDLQGQMDRRFEETQKEIRHASVLVEGVRSEVKAVSEGHSLLAEGLDDLRKEIKLERQLDRGEARSAHRRLRERVERLEAAR